MYSNFFIDQKILFDSKKITKIEYIKSLYGTENLLEWFCTISRLILLPLLSAFFILWILNRLDLIFYEKDLANKKRKEIAKSKSETNLLVDRNKNKVELTLKGRFFLKQFINRESEK
jgi:hypothetical protein